MLDDIVCSLKRNRNNIPSTGESLPEDQVLLPLFRFQIHVLNCLGVDYRIKHCPDAKHHTLFHAFGGKMGTPAAALANETPSPMAVKVPNTFAIMTTIAES